MRCNKNTNKNKERKKKSNRRLGTIKEGWVHTSDFTKDVRKDTCVKQDFQHMTTYLFKFYNNSNNL